MKKLSLKDCLKFVPRFISRRVKGKEVSTTTLLSPGDESEKVQQIRASLVTVLRRTSNEKDKDEKIRRIRESLDTVHYQIPPKKSEPKV